MKFSIPRDQLIQMIHEELSAAGEQAAMEDAPADVRYMYLPNFQSEKGGLYYDLEGGKKEYILRDDPRHATGEIQTAQQFDAPGPPKEYNPRTEPAPWALQKAKSGTEEIAQTDFGPGAVGAGALGLGNLIRTRSGMPRLGGGPVRPGSSFYPPRAGGPWQRDLRPGIQRVGLPRSATPISNVAKARAATHAYGPPRLGSWSVNPAGEIVDFDPAHQRFQQHQVRTQADALDDLAKRRAGRGRVRSALAQKLGELPLGAADDAPTSRAARSRVARAVDIAKDLHADDAARGFRPGATGSPAPSAPTVHSELARVQGLEDDAWKIIDELGDIDDLGKVDKKKLKTARRIADKAAKHGDELLKFGKILRGGAFAAGSAAAGSAALAGVELIGAGLTAAEVTNFILGSGDLSSIGLGGVKTGLNVLPTWKGGKNISWTDAFEKENWKGLDPRSVQARDDRSEERAKNRKKGYNQHMDTGIAARKAAGKSYSAKHASGVDKWGRKGKWKAGLDEGTNRMNRLDRIIEELITEEIEDYVSETSDVGRWSQLAGLSETSGMAAGAVGGAGGSLTPSDGPRRDDDDDDELDEAKDKDWIQKAVNPEHKGYCTPMTKKTCTPKRKALAKRFKKAGKKEKKEGGTGWEGKV